MKQFGKKILSFVLVLCLAIIGMVTTPIFTANAESKTETLSIIANKGVTGNKTISWTGENIKFENQQAGSSTAIRKSDTNEYRVYANSVVEISTVNSANITKIVITTTKDPAVCKTSMANSNITASYSGSTVTATNLNTSKVTFTASAQWRLKEIAVTYEVVETGVDVEAVKAELNEVNAYMGLAYNYEQVTNTEVTDELTADIIPGVTTNSYKAWTKELSVDSTTKYNGITATQHSAIQLNAKSNAGIITTVSAGKATKITVEWNSNSKSGRELYIYGKDTAYGASSDLYDANLKGTKIGAIKCGNSTELVIELDKQYEYIGLVAATEAIYLDSVKITWVGEEATTKLVNSQFFLKCAVDMSVADIANIDENGYGIRVTAGKPVDYTITADSWAEGEDEGVFYVVINLGDIVNDASKLNTEFTVQAYVKVGNVAYASETVKTYSVMGLLEDYKELGYDVDHLYNYLVKE